MVGMDDVTFQSLVQQLDDQLQLTASLTHKHQSLRPGRTWYVLLTPMFKPWTRCGRYTTNPNGSGWLSLPFCITKSQDGWRRVQMLCYKGGPHRVSKKYANFRCQNEPSGQTEKSPNVETLPLYIAKFWSVQTCNFVSVGSRTCIVSYSHFRKVARLHSDFSLEIDHIVIPSEVLCLRPYAPQFLKYGHVPLQPLHTILQSKIIILCSCTHTLRTATSCFTKMSLLCRNLHFDLVSGVAMKVGRVCHVHLSQLWGPRWHWTAFTSTCHKEGSVFWT